MAETEEVVCPGDRLGTTVLFLCHLLVLQASMKACHLCKGHLTSAHVASNAGNARGDAVSLLQDEVSGGNGTYTKNGYIYASRCGFVRSSQSDKEQKRVLSVSSKDDTPLVPAVGDGVTVRVLKLTNRLAVTEILCVGPKAMHANFNGIIRLQDIRALEVDKVKMRDCFRPGDLVRAEVLSLGNMRDYYLTTAKNELGVIWAKSLSGAPMDAISWEEMRCPVTSNVEKRKVAKMG